MTNDEQRPDADALPGSVTGVARGSHGTGTALDDTQVYDVAELNATPAAAAIPAGAAAVPAANAAAVQPAPEPVVAAESPVPAQLAPEQAAPVVTPVPRATPRVAPRHRTGDDRKPRVGAPVAGFVGFALAAGLAIFIGASLGGRTDPGAAGGEATLRAPATEAPEETKANDGDEGEGGGNGNGKGNKGCKGNGRGNCDD